MALWSSNSDCFPALVASDCVLDWSSDCVTVLLLVTMEEPEIMEEPELVEPVCLKDMVWATQMRALRPRLHKKVGTYQDDEEAAPISWRFVEGLVQHGHVLGLGQWPKPEDCGPEDEPVWLVVQCTAMGSHRPERQPRCAWKS